MKEIRKEHQNNIIWKPEKRIVQIPYCPVCKKELKELDKDYRPYYCDCGDWFWNEDEEVYGIYK